MPCINLMLGLKDGSRRRGRQRKTRTDYIRGTMKMNCCDILTPTRNNSLEGPDFQGRGEKEMTK